MRRLILFNDDFGCSFGLGLAGLLGHLAHREPLGLMTHLFSLWVKKSTTWIYTEFTRVLLERSRDSRGLSCFALISYQLYVWQEQWRASRARDAVVQGRPRQRESPRLLRPGGWEKSADVDGSGRLVGWNHKGPNKWRVWNVPNATFGFRLVGRL